MKLLSDALLERGFLVEAKDGQVFLTSNAWLKGYCTDDDFLRQLTQIEAWQVDADQNERFGFDQRTHDKPHLYACLGSDYPIDTQRYKALFKQEHYQGYRDKNLPCRFDDLDLFTRYDCAPKVPLRVLDAHMALLVKALGAVGCWTSHCCAGRVRGQYPIPLHLEFNSPINARWAAYLVEKAQSAGLKLPDLSTDLRWGIKETERSFQSPQRSLLAPRKQAINLGKFIYQNRMQFRAQRYAWANNLRAL